MSLVGDWKRAISKPKLKADPDNDEFDCDKCGGIFDIDQSHRIGKDELYCDACYKVLENIFVKHFQKAD